MLPGLRQAWSQITMPETLPAIDAVTIDAEGFYWVLRPAGDPTAARSYEVFDPNGVLLGAVSVPAGLVHSIQPRPVIGTDFFLGLWVDEFGVESLRLYALYRGKVMPYDAALPLGPSGPLRAFRG